MDYMIVRADDGSEVASGFATLEEAIKVGQEDANRMRRQLVACRRDGTPPDVTLYVEENG